MAYNYNYGTSSGSMAQLGNDELRKRDQAISEAGLYRGGLDDALRGFYDNGDYSRNLSNAANAAVNKNYDNAVGTARTRAMQAGFGYSQPLTVAAETGVERGRADALSQVPLQVQDMADQRKMQAIQQQQGLLSSLQQTASMYDPMSAYSTAVQRKQQEDANKGGLWSSLANLGLGIANIGTGGGSTLASTALGIGR